MQIMKKEATKKLVKQFKSIEKWECTIKGQIYDKADTV